MRNNTYKGISFDIDAADYNWLRTHVKRIDSDISKVLRRLIRDLRSKEEQGALGCHSNEA